MKSFYNSVILAHSPRSEIYGTRCYSIICYERKVISIPPRNSNNNNYIYIFCSFLIIISTFAYNHFMLKQIKFKKSLQITIPP